MTEDVNKELSALPINLTRVRNDKSLDIKIPRFNPNRVNPQLEMALNNLREVAEYMIKRMK